MIKKKIEKSQIPDLGCLTLIDEDKCADCGHTGLLETHTYNREHDCGVLWESYCEACKTYIDHQWVESQSS